MSEPVVVVGAGIAGLVAARDVARTGRRVVVVDEAQRLGGQIEAVEVAGLLVDAGAEGFAVRGGAVAALAAELGCEVVHPAEGPAWLIRADGDARPLPATSVLGIPAVPLAADVVDIIGRRAAWRAMADRLAPMLRTDKYASLGDLVRRRMGQAVVDELVAPVVRGVYSTTPDALPIAAASPELPAALRATGSLAAAVASIREASPAGSQVASIAGGMHRLVAALGERLELLDVELRLGERVLAVDERGVDLADGERLDGEVVVAAPGLVSERAAEREITVVVAVVDAPGLDTAPRGTGALVAAGAPGVAARAFTDASAKWAWAGDACRAGAPHRHLVRCSYDAPPADPASAIASDLRAIAGLDDVVVVDHATRTWRRTLAAAPPPPGIRVVGEADSRSGLARIVPGARALAADLIEKQEMTQ